MGRIIDYFRRDSVWMGVLLGALCPAIVFAILKGVIHFVEGYNGLEDLIETQKIILLSIVPSIFLLRYYLLKLKYDLTGRGILGVTFVIAIIFAILEFSA